MSSELLLHPHTKKVLTSFISRPRHAVLLEGETGSGRYTVACFMTSHLLKIPHDRVSSHHAVCHVMPINGSIGVDAIRDLQHFLKLSTTGKGLVRRVIIIEEAGSMTTEAQNALLKILEEPPADAVMILAATVGAEGLLPTVLSRVQIVRVLPVGQQQLINYFENLGYNHAAVKRAALLADGAVGTTAALLSKDHDHPLVGAIEQAKGILKASVYERLLLVDKLSKDREAVRVLLAALYQVTQALMRQSLVNQPETATRQSVRVIAMARHIHEARQSLTSNLNLKLLLTDLFMSL